MKIYQIYLTLHKNLLLDRNVYPQLTEEETEG